MWMGGKSVSEKKRERAVTGLTKRLCGCMAVVENICKVDGSLKRLV